MVILSAKYLLPFLILIIAVLKFGSQTESRESEEYDFIVVGAGAAGCVVARRLSEKYTVLLLEAGDEPDPQLDIPAVLDHGYNEFNFRTYKSLPEKRANLVENGTIEFYSGTALGGGTAVNNMIYNRGNPHDYDNWANITGDSSWKYEQMLKYFKRIEDYDGEYPLEPYHGKGGPITISRQKYGPGQKTWLAGGKSLGFLESDPNGYQIPSFAPVEFNKRHGRRVSSYYGYIKPVLASGMKNLRLMKNAVVKRVIFEGKRAVGVAYDKSGEEIIARSKKEVVLSAGVMSSPVILLKSGVGPEDVLQSSKIPPVKILKVGYNLHDHLVVRLFFRVKSNEADVFDPERDLTETTWEEYQKTGDGPYSCYLGINAEAFLVSPVRSDQGFPNSKWPDLQLTLMPAAFNSPEEDNKDYRHISVIVTFTRPKSREGNITLNSTNVESDPLITYQFFRHSDDMKALVYGVKKTVHLLEKTSPYKQQESTFVSPNLKCNEYPARSNKYWKCYIEHMSFGASHAGGTCRMGSGSSDSDAVVDSKLRVIGIDNLRVADLSIVPVITNSNTQAPALAIGEKAAEEIIKRWSC